MSVYWKKSRGQWCYDFLKHKTRYTGYCIHPETKQPATSKRSAREIETLVKASIKKPADIPNHAGAYTLAEAAADYGRHKGSRNRSWEKDILRQIGEILRHFGPETPVASITVDRIDEYVDWCRQQPHRTYIGGPTKGAGEFRQHPTRKRTDSTTNRYLATLRAILRRAARSGKAPAAAVLRLQEPEEQPNPIAEDKLKLAYGLAPEHVKDTIFLALATGMRLREVLGLKWAQIDFERAYVRLTSGTKGKRGAVVFLNSRTLERLQEIRAAQPAGCANVVTFKGGPIGSIKTAWNNLRAAAGIPGHRFHDLRANFCTALGTVPEVTPTDVQKAARHRSVKTTMRYLTSIDPRQRRAIEALPLDFVDKVTDNSPGQIGDADKPEGTK